MIVIIPAYQPDEKLVSLVDALERETDYHILVVNDGSDADRAPIFEKLSERCTVLCHEVNRGKGAAIKTALSYVRDECPDEDAVVTVDADGQHLISDIVSTCEDWRQHPDALVLGSRRFTGKVPFKSRAGNAITRIVFGLSTGVRVHDTQTGLRVFSTKYIPIMLDMKGDRYEYEINVLLYATRAHIPIREVTIETVYINDNAGSHFHPFRDAWRIYKMILLFVVSSLLAAGLDYVLVLLLSACTRGVVRHWLLISVVGARILSSFVNYFVNRQFVFESKSNRSVVRYYLVATGILVLNYILMALTVGCMALPLAKILVEVVLYPLSFYLQRRFVFSEGKER